MTCKTLRNAIIYAAALLAPVAAAQPSDPASLISQICSVSGQRVLGSVTVGEAVSRLGIDPEAAFFFCNYSGVIRRAERLGNNFVNGMSSLAEGIGEDLLVQTLDVLGRQIGAQSWNQELNEHLAGANDQLNEALQGIEEGGEFALSAYREALQEAFDQARDSAQLALEEDIANPGRHPEGTQERREAEHLSIDPIAASATRELNEALIDTAQQRTEATAALKASETAAASYLSDTGYADIVASVVTPSNPTDPSATAGTAAQLEEAATRATSTREAINELSRGFADYMRQDAVLTANVVEGLRASVQQQAITNWQMQQAAERELQKEYAKIEARQAQLRAELELGNAEIEHVFGALINTVDAVEQGFGFEPDPEFCALVGGC